MVYGAPDLERIAQFSMTYTSNGKFGGGAEVLRHTSGECAFVVYDSDGEAIDIRKVSEDDALNAISRFQDLMSKDNKFLVTDIQFEGVGTNVQQARGMIQIPEPRADQVLEIEYEPGDVHIEEYKD